MKSNDPDNYAKWATVKASMGQGILGQFSAGNAAADFVNEWVPYYQNKSAQGPGGLRGAVARADG